MHDVARFCYQQTIFYWVLQYQDMKKS